jgi:hypothetical protein
MRLDAALSYTASFFGWLQVLNVGRINATFTGAWAWAGYHLATTIATPAAYAYLPFAIASLGWAGGIIALVAGIATTWYCSILLASLSEYNGVRYVRYRDLAQSIIGPWGKWGVVACQQIASLGNNITLGIVAGTLNTEEHV